MTARLRLAALFAALFAAVSPARGHEGHDDRPSADAPARAVSAIPATGPSAPTWGGALPRRLPDGSLWLPKASQRLVGVRTVPVSRATLPRSVELPGRVTVDPDAAGRVQSTVAGRIEPGPRGLPAIGSSVAKGETLARVRPSLEPLARSERRALLAELEAGRDLAALRLARLRGLSDTVPRREIEAAESGLAALEGRLQAASAGLVAAERLVAPVAGVVARAEAVAGQVVEPRDLLFEIVDPTRLRIEATGFDLALPPRVLDASVEVAGRAVPLAFVGAGRVLREQTVPLVFRGSGPALAALAVGQPLPVTVRLRGEAEGVAVPAASLVRSAANEPIVWVKTQPERFEPRRVRTQPLDAARVRVVDGLAGGERVVTEGAALLGQFR
jgi:hypothetical protein